MIVPRVPVTPAPAVAGPGKGGQNWAQVPVHFDIVLVSGTNQYRVKPLELVSTVAPPILVVFSALPDDDDPPLPEPVVPELPHPVAISAAAARLTGTSHLLPIATLRSLPGSSDINDHVKSRQIVHASAPPRRRLKSKGRPAWLTAVLLSLVVAAGCAANQSAAERYMAIALPANHQLDKEVDSYNAHAHHDLAAAEAALRAEAATERWFDQRLLKIAFPPTVAATAMALVRVNDRRIALTRQQARAETIARLISLDARNRAADAAVEVQVRIIRKQLGLPPPDNS